jgi:hypothetical protein
MKMRDDFDPAIDEARVAEYLEGAGLRADPEIVASIASWRDLQEHVSRADAIGAEAMPFTPRRLTTYGLKTSHPLTLLVRHVVS